MSTNTPIKRKQGRPFGSGVYDQRLPEIRVSNSQLKIYRQAASNSGQSFSDWIRSSLDNSLYLSD